jgi:DNA polymerase I
MVAAELDERLEPVRLIKIGEGEFGSSVPFDTGPDTLFVAYSAWAEMTCFLVLGWEMPTHVFCQHTAYLAASNRLLPYNPGLARVAPPKGLEAAAAAYGLHGWDGIEKGVISPAIGDGTWRGKYSLEEVMAYCAADVAVEVALLREQLRGQSPMLPAADTARVIWWSEYSSKAIAKIQARGMPIDLPLWNLVQENKAPVIKEMLRRFDPSHNGPAPIYSLDGSWSYDRFEQHLYRSGIRSWPRHDNGMLDASSKAFELMAHLPGIGGLHALRDSVGFIAKARLPIGSDGRNRPSLFPFGTATGRNAHRRSPYNAHAAMRSFMKFDEGTKGVYLDWRTQEIGIAAALSGDEVLRQDYEAGDIYHALAVMCGLTDDPDPVRWKKNNKEVRQRMKALQLGIGYGMGVKSLSKGLGRHQVVASWVIQKHKRRYARFWEWRENFVELALLDRKTESAFGWPLHLTTAPNTRTLYNFPMQSGGAECLRLAAMRLCDAGVVPIMLIHDGILFQEEDDEKLELAREIMLSAGRDVCSGLELGVDVAQTVQGGDRYRDERDMAKDMWALIIGVLRDLGALPKGMVA